MTSRRQIDDRKPAKSKAAAAFIKDQFTCIVGATVRHHVAHPLDQSGLDVSARRAIFPDSADAAHALDFRSQISNSRLSVRQTSKCVDLFRNEVSTGSGSDRVSTRRQRNLIEGPPGRYPF